MEDPYELADVLAIGSVTWHVGLTCGTATGGFDPVKDGQGEPRRLRRAEDTPCAHGRTARL
eukprot:491367-Hanusia_phi.AAC.1